MADEITAKVTGVEEVMSNIKQFAIASPTAIMNGVKRVAGRIERQAKLNITTLGAVDTGRLQASITHNWRGSGMSHGAIKSPVKETKQEDGIGQPQEKKNVFSATIGTNVKYGPYIEFGHAVHSKQGEGGFYGLQVGVDTTVPERPYLYPAYFSHEHDVADEVSLELGKELAKAMKK